MLEVIENTGKAFGSEIGVFIATIVIAAIKRKLEKRKLRRQGKLRDKKYFEDNIRHMTKWN